MPEEKTKNISVALKSLMEERGVDAESLSVETDIPKRFITSLIDGSSEQLPARPYVRGYLFKIAEALNADPNALWKSYRISADLSSSGEHDKLPSNRFAFKKIGRSKIVGAFFVIVIVAFVGFRFNEILGKPTLDIVLPESTPEETITVSGNVSPGDRLTLNGEVIYPNEEGFFEKRVQLEPGLNTLDFNIKRYLGQETNIVRQVFYQPVEIIEPTQQNGEENG